ncbi:MAG: hypothetical protein OXC48_10665, partial [Endozoicomonadaceae bacterium]|nr:hypothetical protein [Endozoicomonadaceae bacterium]
YPCVQAIQESEKKGQNDDHDNSHDIASQSSEGIVLSEVYEPPQLLSELMRALPLHKRKTFLEKILVSAHKGVFDFIAKADDKQLTLMNIYIQSSHTQRNTAIGLLASTLEEDPQNKQPLRQLYIPPNENETLSKEAGLYAFYVHGQKKFFPHVTTEQLTHTLVVMINAGLAAIYPIGLIIGGAAQVCDTSVGRQCITALLSLISRLNITELLQNAVSPDQLQSLTHENVIELITNGSLPLNTLSLQNVNFTEESFFSVNPMRGALIEYTIDHQQVLLALGLLFSLNYLDSLTRRTLLPVLLRLSDKIQSLYNKCFINKTLISASRLNQVIDKLVENGLNVSVANIAIKNLNKKNIDLEAFLAGIMQADVKSFILALKDISIKNPDKYEQIYPAMKNVLLSTHSALPPQTESHRNVIQDIRDLINHRGDRPKLIANIAANITNVFLTAGLIYGMVIWADIVLSLQPTAFLDDVDFGLVCNSWHSLQHTHDGNNCTLVNGTVKDAEWPFFYEAAFDFTLISASLLSTNMRKLSRGGFQLTYNMIATLFRLALYWRCCVQPSIPEYINGNATDDADGEGCEEINDLQHTETCFSHHEEGYNTPAPKEVIIDLEGSMKCLTVSSTDDQAEHMDDIDENSQ